MKVYTKSGDTGETALFGGARVRKSHAQVCAYGAVDEACASVGVASSAPDCPDTLRAKLDTVMADLFDLGAELATPDEAGAEAKLSAKLSTAITAARIAQLEAWIDAADAELPALRSFVLPGGADAAARLHLARCVVRRAERAVVGWADAGGAVRAEVLAYLNRLSDLLFVWARVANVAAGRGDVLWTPARPRSTMEDG